MPTGRSGASHETTRWSRPITPPYVRDWPSRLAWDASRHRLRSPSPRGRSRPRGVRAAQRPEPACARRRVSVAVGADKMVGMFTVDEATSEAIRRAVGDGGELAGGVELRRHFPLITDNAHARRCVQVIAGWKPLPIGPGAPPNTKPAGAAARARRNRA